MLDITIWGCMEKQVSVILFLYLSRRAGKWVQLISSILWDGEFLDSADLREGAAQGTHERLDELRGLRLSISDISACREARSYG